MQQTTEVKNQPRDKIITVSEAANVTNVNVSPTIIDNNNVLSSPQINILSNRVNPSNKNSSTSTSKKYGILSSLKKQVENQQKLLDSLIYSNSMQYCFAVGEEVKCRDLHGMWRTGVVTSLKPLLVRQYEFRQGITWDEVSPLQGENHFKTGNIVWTKINGVWIKGEVIYIRNIAPIYAFRSGVITEFFNTYGSHAFDNHLVHFRWLNEEDLLPDGASDVEDEMQFFLNDLVIASALQNIENEWASAQDEQSEAIAHLIGENEIQKLNCVGEAAGNEEFKAEFHNEIVAGYVQEGEYSVMYNVDVFREGEEALFQGQNDEEISRQIEEGEKDEEKKK